MVTKYRRMIFVEKKKPVGWYIIIILIIIAVLVSVGK